MSNYTRLNPNAWSASELSLLNGKLVLRKRGNVVMATFKGYNHGAFTGQVTVTTLPVGWRPLDTAYFLNDLDRSNAMISTGGGVILNSYWSERNVWAGCTYVTA